MEPKPYIGLDGVQAALRFVAAMWQRQHPFACGLASPQHSEGPWWKWPCKSSSRIYHG